MHDQNGAPSGQMAAPGIFDDSVTAWMHEGNCRLYPPSTFFPSDGVGVDKARKICAGCPVMSRCLEYALEQRIDHGVWGGCSERERRRILKRRRLSVDRCQLTVVRRSGEPAPVTDSASWRRCGLARR